MIKNWAKISKIVQNWQNDATILMKLKHFKSCLWFFVFFKFKLLERTAENCECTTVKRKRPSKLRKLSKTEQICSKLTKQSNNFCETEAFQIMFVIYCIFQIYTTYYVGCDINVMIYFMEKKLKYTVVCIKVRTASFPRFLKNHP